MVAATAEQAAAYVSNMESVLSCRIVTRANAIELQILRAFLSSHGIPDITHFESGRSITIGPLVYLSDGLTPDETLVTVTHECQHVWQQHHGGFLKTAYAYLVSGEARVRLEADGYRAGAEVDWLRTHRTPALHELTDHLATGYLLSTDDLRLAEGLFGIAMASMSHGVIGTVAAHEFRKWALASAPSLLV